MGALKDLLASERGLIALALIIASTVLAATGHQTMAEWKELVIWVFGTYVAGKTVTGAVQIMKGQTAPPGDQK